MSTTARTSGVSLAAWFAIALGIVWLVALGGGYYGIYGSELRAISVVITALALSVSVIAAIRNPSWRPQSAIWPALALPVAAFAVTTLLSSRPRVSVEYLGYSVLLVALYLLLRALLAHSGFRDRITGLTVVLALVLGGWYLWAVLGRWIDWWEVVGAFRVPPLRPYFESLTYGNPSAVLTMSVLLTAAAVAHLGLATRGRRISIGGMIVLAGTVALLSGSRAGWLAVGVAVGAVGLAALVSPAGRRAMGRTLRTPAARLGAFGLVVVGSVGLVVFGPGILFRAGTGGEDLRAGYLAVSARMFASAPIAGQGAGTWAADRIAETIDGETDYYIPHAHNVVAQTAAEHGIVGLVAGAVAVGCLAWLIVGALRDQDATRRRWGWAALFATVYFGVHNLLDFYANMPAALFAYALPIAWLDATATRSITERLRAARIQAPAGRRLKASAAVVGIAVLTIATVGLVAQETPAGAAADGRLAADRGDWGTALPPLRAASEDDPQMPSYAFALGLAEAHAGDAAAALAALERIATSDDLPVAWLDVAILRLGSGDGAGSRDAMDRAMRLGRQQPAILFATATLLEDHGDTSAADAAWAATLRSMPSLAGDPWWTDPLRADRWPSIRDAALSGMAPEIAADLWLSSGSAEQAALAADQIADPAARERTNLAIAAWDGDPTNRAKLDAYAQDHPFDLVAVAWAGRVAARAGDLAAVDDYRLWADTVNGNAAAGVGEVRVAMAEDDRDSLMGLTGTFWGQYTYRRATPRDQLLPAVPQLVLTP